MSPSCFILLLVAAVAVKADLSMPDPFAVDVAIKVDNIRNYVDDLVHLTARLGRQILPLKNFPDMSNLKRALALKDVVEKDFDYIQKRISEIQPGGAKARRPLSADVLFGGRRGFRGGLSDVGLSLYSPLFRRNNPFAARLLSYQ